MTEKGKIVAVLMAGLGIILGNTVADFTNDATGWFFQGNSSPPPVMLTCTPSP